MTTETQSVVRAAYERALQEHLQKNLRTSADWDRFNTIKRERDAPLMIEQAAFKRDYIQRLSDAKQIILREENGVSLDQPLPPWVDAHSNAEALQSKADIGAWVFVANRLCDSDCKCVWHGGPAGLVDLFFGLIGADTTVSAVVLTRPVSWRHQAKVVNHGAGPFETRGIIDGSLKVIIHVHTSSWAQCPGQENAQGTRYGPPCQDILSDKSYLRPTRVHLFFSIQLPKNVLPVALVTKTC